MAGATTKSRDNVGHDQGADRDHVLQFNKAVDDLDALRTKINAVITAAATSLAAVAAVPAAAAIAAGKIGNENGTPLT
jgi:hypothetical protein